MTQLLTLLIIKIILTKNNGKQLNAYYNKFKVLTAYSIMAQSLLYQQLNATQCSHLCNGLMNYATIFYDNITNQDL